MAATLLIKEFVDLARTLGKQSEREQQRFSDFLQEKGYANLNEYKAKEEDTELAAKRFSSWTEALQEEGDFQWDMTAPEVKPKEKKPEETGVPRVVHLEREVEPELPEEKETRIEDIVRDVHDRNNDENAMEVLRIVKEGFANLANVSQVQGNPNHGKAIDSLVNRNSALERLIKNVRDEVEALKVNSGGSFQSFDIHIHPADKKWEGEQPLHYKFPLVAAAVTNRIPTMIVGPAGWGKTSTIKALADVCEESWEDNSVDYRIQSIGPQTSKSDILGYMDANGNYVKSVFYECFSKGMLYACDEADAGSAGSLTLLNQGFANQECHFPGQEGMTERHENFVPLFLANTFGLGANATYVGRNQLDAATIDRFAVVEYDYDEKWEGKICGVDREGAELKLDAGGKRTDQEWVEWVGRIRNAIDSLAIRHVVSPRASINGIKLLKAGLGFTHVSNMCVWKGMDSATRAKVINETNV